ncbi:MAG: hypothetical protein ACREMY_25910, partial [bacterium]
MTDNLEALRLIYGFTYALIPIVTLVVCWLIVRTKAPHLIVWPVLGVTISCLPGQLFLVSEGIIATHLCWILLLIALVGFWKYDAIVLGLLAAFVFSLHPFATPILTMVALAAVWSGLKQPERRRRLYVVAAVLLLMALVRLTLIQGSEFVYFSTTTMATLIRGGLTPLVVLALILGWVAGTVVMIASRFVPSRRLFVGAVIGSLVLAWAAFLSWAAQPAQWAQALDYRIFAIAAAFPFYVFLAVEALAPAPQVIRSIPGNLALRSLAVELASLIFCTTLVVQSAVWWGLQANLYKNLMASDATCVSPTSLERSGT